MNNKNTFSKVDIIVLVILFSIFIVFTPEFRSNTKRKVTDNAVSSNVADVVPMEKHELNGNVPAYKKSQYFAQKIETIEKTILLQAANIEELRNQIQQNKTSNYIYIEDAIVKYKICRTTIQKKVNKYKIEKQKRGKRTLVNESQLIVALEKKESKPYFTRSKEV